MVLYHPLSTIHPLLPLTPGQHDFATVARLLSEDMRTAVGGGDMGFAPEEAMAQTYPDVLVKRFFTMREGEITEPIQGSEGRMYIFKVTGKKTEPEELKLTVTLQGLPAN